MNDTSQGLSSSYTSNGKFVDSRRNRTFTTRSHVRFPDTDTLSLLQKILPGKQDFTCRIDAADALK